MFDGQGRQRDVRRGLLAEQRLRSEPRLGHSLVERALRAEAHHELVLGESDGDVLAEVLGSHLEVVATGGPGGGEDPLRRDVPHCPHPGQVRVLAQDRVRRGLSVAGEVRSRDALLCRDLDVGVRLLHRRLEALVPLLRHEEIRLVVDEADFSLAPKGLRHQVCGDDAVAVVVGRDDRDVVAPRGHSLRRVVHEDQLDAGLGRGLVRTGRRDRVGGERDDDVRVFRHDRLDVGDLLVRLEVGIRHGDDLDTELGELVLQAGYLGDRPVVAAVVHGDGGLRPHTLDLGDLLGGEIRCAWLGRVLAVGALAQNRPGDLLEGSVSRLCSGGVGLCGAGRLSRRAAAGQGKGKNGGGRQ